MRSWRSDSAAGWIEAHLATLTDAAHSAVIEGDALLHMDVRSDNLCLRKGRALLVDWNFACTGNPRFDLAAWLPSLHAEGGPAPEEVVPPAEDMAAFASVLAGYFAAACCATRHPRGAARASAPAQAGPYRAAVGGPGAGSAPSDASRLTRHLQRVVAPATHCYHRRREPFLPRLRRRHRPAAQQGLAHDPPAPSHRHRGDADPGTHLPDRHRPHGAGRRCRA